jgi:hypothetical protein
MPYALFVTTPEGVEYIHNPAPVGYPSLPPETKFAAALGVIQVFANEGVKISIREAKQAGRELLGLDTGTPYQHPCGLTFMIKEL